MKKILLLNIFALMLLSIQMSAQCTIQVVTSDITQETCVGSSDASATATGAGAGTISYLWSDGQTTATATNLTTGTYTVTATDNSGCTGTATAEITLDPEGVWLMFTFTPVTCNDGNDGTAHVSVMTGVAPYTYIWNDPAGTTNADPVNLSAGTYTVTVTDTNGCSNYGPVTITQPTTIVVTSNTTNETCSGVADGTATVSPSGGTPGYTYLWSDGQTTATANNLTAGDYIVTVTDSNGCTSISTLTVESTNPLIAITGTPTPVSCFGGNDGSATVVVNSGNGPFSYLWDNGQTTATANNLIAGDFTVTVTGANGCTSITTVTIPEPPILTVTTTTTMNVLCYGGSNGSITVSSNGGTGTVTYGWSNGETTGTISNLIAGIYTVTATDGNGCTATTSETITEPSELTVTGSGTNVTVIGGNDGTATATPSGGTPGYTYLWSNGQTTATAINLTAGTYTVTVTDSNGCTTTTIVEDPPCTVITLTTSHSNETCVGSMDGHVAVSTSGGTGQMTFLWSNGATTSVVNNLSVGTYTVTVTDQDGCTALGEETIELSPEGIWVDITTTNACFNGSNGTANAIVTTGVAPYTYAWSNGATTANITGLAAGDYTVNVTDSNGCIGVFTATVGEENQIVLTTSHSNETCVGSMDGHVAVSTSGGVGQMTFLWSNGATTSVVNNLSVGTYTVTVTDENNCTATGEETIELSPEGIWVDITTTNTCVNGSAGTANAIVTTGVAPYTYAWNNGATTANITGLSAGNYTVTVTDSNSCIGVFTAEVTVSISTIVITTISTMDPSNPGASDGAIDIEPSGGSGTNYTYLWSNGAITQDISGLVAGCYTVIVSNNGSQTCETICIPQVPCELTLEVTTTNNNCLNNNIGTATATITSNCSSTTYTYSWTDSTGASVGTTQTISGLLNGTYLVTVTDGNGLTVTGSGVVTGANGITSTITGTNNLCNGDSTGTATVTGMGGSTYTYMWSNNGTTQTITTLTAGTYTVTVTDTVTGCTSVSQVTIVEPPVTTITATTTPPTTTGGSDGTITVTVTGGTPGYTYLWSNGGTTPTIMAPVGCYTVTVTDANGCTATAEPCITDPPPCVLSLSSTPETCNPGNNGTVMASIIGCNPPVSFVWENSNEVVVGNTAMIMNLPAGMYFVTATDANLISLNDSIEVTYVGGPDVNISSEDIACFDNITTDGQVSATPTGGATPYSYNWEDVNGVIVGSTDTIFNLSAGIYSVTVTDAVGCTAVDVVEIEIDDPITLAHIMTPLNCFGDANASISVTAMGGVSPYTYLWSNSIANDSITGLSSGVYTVTITDQNLCTKVDSFVISQPIEVTVSTDPDTSICENFLTVNATASAGAAITWYDQISPLGSPLGTGSPFAYLNIPSGVNTLYAIAELNGCPAIDSMVVMQNAIDVSVSSSTSVCLGDATQLMATNNILSQDVDYVWTPTNLFVIDTDTLANPTLVNSDTGTYEVYLYSINEFNCEQFDTVTVSVQDTTTNFIIKQQCIGLEVNYTSTSGLEMIWNFGDGSPQDTAISTTHTYMSANDYTVMMIFPPGTNNAACLADTVTQVIAVADDPIFDTGFTLEYDTCIENSTMVIFTDTSTNIFGSIDSVWWVWQGDTISTNPQDSMLITQSVMDSLTLIVMSEDGCVDSISQDIEINVINVILADTIIACVGVDTFLNPNGNPSYQYTWSPAPNGDPNEFNPMITATVSTSYSVTITDLSGTNPCSIVEEVYVLVPSQLNDLMVTSDPDSILCAEGILTLEASSSSASSYNWYNEYPFDPIILNSPTLDTLLTNMDAPQYYYVEAMDQYGCPTVDSIFAGNAEIISALNDVDNCLNTSLTILGGAASNGEMLMYEWFDPNGMPIGMDSTLTFTPEISGTYTVNVSNEYGCEIEETFNINIIDISANIEAIADPDTIILGETVQLDVIHPNNVEGYKYLWSPASSLLGNNPTEDKAPEAMPDVDTEYQVVVTDLDNGCTVITNVLVTVLDICERPYVFFPNVFSPNGDGRNDVLKVESVVVDEVYFVIYNRWGEKVFEGNSVDSAWDGMHNGEAVSNDVYGYYLQARCVNGKTYEEKGNVTVLR
ncbi:MAG: gliding motility-associated C-terminal domain-containing protein [Saprospiraceae bacterium]